MLWYCGGEGGGKDIFRMSEIDMSSKTNRNLSISKRLIVISLSCRVHHCMMGVECPEKTAVITG